METPSASPNTGQGREAGVPESISGVSASVEWQSQQVLEAQLEAVAGLDSVSGALRPHQNELLISTCGRTVSVEMRETTSILELQKALQRILVMEGQLFQFFDVNGAALA